MSRNRKIVGSGTLFVLFFVLLASQLNAQSPTAASTTPTPAATATATTTTPITPTPSTVTAFIARQAVVKRSIDGDTVEAVFTDNGEVAMVHLANVDAPKSVDVTECFGRESAEYALQRYRDSPLISIELVGEIKEGEGSGYVHLADGTLLNMVMVLFGYARFGDTTESVYTDQIKNAEAQSKQGKTGLWRSCGETEKPPRPCFLFNHDEMDSGSKREVLAQLEEAAEISATFRYAYYDPVQNEIIVSWKLSVDDSWSDWWVDEYYRLPDCLRDRSVMIER